ELMNMARSGNKYLADQAPWTVIKEDEERVKTIMYVALQVAAGLAVLSEPFLPYTATALRRMLSFDNRDHGSNLWMADASPKELLPAGHQLGSPELLFRKIEDKEIQQQVDKLEATRKKNETEETEVIAEKDTIQFEDFSALDLRVGTILEAEKMPKTKKLLVLKVDTGIDTRTIVSGISESFAPEDIIGKQVTVLVNLAPRKLRGVESQGMILMTENQEGKLVFVSPAEAGVGNGTTIN
ncbi:MAG: methionine--tRNA ligase subunit beta, partial [Flavobacteriaceae bacterium]|nr:methionine--tRNA ligase subunit beta [Flavobacteriaceae bacterium]